MNKYKKVIKELKKYNKFLITSHINPEGDSLGSQLAFSYLLKALGKSYYILNAEIPGDKYKFLPNINSITTKIKKGLAYDAVCFLDCADIQRVGDVSKKINLDKLKINIDHHLSNIYFGDINLVESNLSSAGEVIYNLFKEAKIKINKEAAICLYAAIVSDTGSFRYSNVTSATHEIAADLIGTSSINAYEIYKNIFEEISPAAIKLLSKALPTIKLNKAGTVAWMKVTKNMLSQSKATLKDAGDFISFPRSIQGVKVAMLFTELETDKLKVSFRANDIVDVNKIAMLFGGGGHKKASGCSIKGILADAEKKVLAVVEKHV